MTEPKAVKNRSNASDSLDPSRYRVARAIVERYEAGEDAWTLAHEYGTALSAFYTVELIVAAYEEGKRDA